MNKKIWIWICCAAIATLVVGGSVAYFSDAEKVENKFTVAGKTGTTTGLDIEVTEPNWDETQGLNLMPGNTVAKDPTVANLKDTSYVRMIVTLVDGKTGAVIKNAARASKILQMIRYSPGLSATDSCTEAEMLALPQINSKFVRDTTRSSAGIYYFNYNGVLAKSGAANSSAILFTNVIVPLEWDQDDLTLIGDYNIVVEGQAIQAANLTYAEAFNALDTQLLTP